MSATPSPSTEALAKRVRIHALKMTSRGGSSHVGAAFSMADLLAVLYGKVMRIDPTRPKWVERDRFVLSKGHAGAAVYATLAEVGYFPAEQLEKHYQDGSVFSGHVSHKGIPGVEVSTGSLGHGLGVAAGMAKALQLSGSKSKVYALLSDGECDEGSVWEAVLFAAHHHLENLVAVIDYNKIQSLASVSEIMELEPFRQKWESFNWNCVESDGHDHRALEAAFAAKPRIPGQPTVLIAHTVKGKGVSFMENTVLWHYRTARGAEFDAAMAELEKL